MYYHSDPGARGRDRFGDVDEKSEPLPKPAQSGGEDEDGCWHCKGHPVTKRGIKDKKTKGQKKESRGLHHLSGF